jgi:RND family efflux transporter MFP subunit
MEAFKLITADKVDAKIAVPENEIGSVFLKQDAVIEVPALNGERFTGKVETKGVVAHPLTHTYEVKIRIENNVGARQVSPLLPGMVCKVYLEQPDTTAGIVIPNRAVQIAYDGKRYVWIADNGTAKRRFVTTGVLNNNGVTIDAGLSNGDRLIVEGYQKVSEGMKINILN